MYPELLKSSFWKLERCIYKGKDANKLRFLELISAVLCQSSFWMNDDYRSCNFVTLACILLPAKVN